MNQKCQEEFRVHVSDVHRSGEGTEACKVVDNTCIFHLGDRLNLLSDGGFECSNGVRFALVDDIL